MPRPTTDPVPAGRFDVDGLADLPEPARRNLVHAIAPGTPLWRSVHLTMRGQIKLGGTWRPFTARQVLTASGFVWSATVRIAGMPVTGFDRLTGGAGRMRWRLLGLIPVTTGHGPDVTRSAAGRVAGELACWLPTTFPAACWSVGPDADTAVATYPVGDERVAVHLRVGADGRLREVHLDRWGNPDAQPFGYYPFGVSIGAERTFDGVRIPSQIRAGWWFGTERQPDGEFFRAEVTGADFG